MTADHQSGLRIRLFQTFEVALSGQSVARFEAESARALLAYLAMHPGRTFRRETLAALLWDADDAASALTNLRAALRRIRTALHNAQSGQGHAPVEFILADRTTLTFNPAAPVWVDALDFEARLVEARRHDHAAVEECRDCNMLLTDALALYRGPFLADLALDIPAYEEWRRSESERLQRRALNALYTLGEYAFRTGSFEEAKAIARRQLNIESWNEEAHRQLMRVLFASGRRTAALAQYEICRRALAEELGVDPGEETQALFYRLLAGESPMPRSVGSNPYKGLAPFGPGDTEVFFGRSSETQRLYTAIVEQGVAALVGASGSGKSSLINAGLTPTLRGQRSDGYVQPAAARAGAAVTTIIEMRPGSDPLTALDDALTKMPTDGTELPDALLIVDQFEELFAFGADDGTRTAFLDRLLPRAAAAPRLLLAMRADFLGEALRHAALAELLQEHAILLGPLSRGGLRQVIEDPARLRGVTFEPGLVDRLLLDIGDGPDHLPLLQFALTQLWERQMDGWVTHEALDAIGGVRGALARYAEEVFTALSPAQQAQAQRIFLTLVQPAGDAQDVRRMATRSEIGEELWPLVHHLADARLLVTDHNDRTGDTVELIHEALIREWQRLQAWLELDREFQIWRQRTRTALEAWAENPADEATLLQGARLLDAERWLGERSDEIAAPLREYIAASIAARERRSQAEEVARQRELASVQSLAQAEHQRADAEARARRQLTWLTFGLVVVAVLAAFAALIAFRTQQIADTERDNAQQIARLAMARQLSAQAINAQQTDIDVALLLNHESLLLNEDAKERAELLLKTDVDPRLLRILHGSSGAIFGLRVQADGQRVQAHNEFGNILVWPAAGGAQHTVLASDEGEPQGVLMEAQSRYIATWRGDVITIRDAETGAALQDLDAPAGVGLQKMAFSSDRSRLVSFWDDDLLRIWDVASGALLEEYSMGEYATNLARQNIPVVVTPDGHVIMLVDEQNNRPLIVLWDVQVDQAFATLPQNHTDEIHQVSVSPDGALLATASYDGSVRLWDTATGAQQGEPLLGHTARALFAVFSPDGRQLVSGGADDQVILWDVATGLPIGPPLRGHSKAVRAAAFSADGARLFTGDSDGRVLEWDAGMIHELPGHDERVRAMLLSPDEGTLVTAGFDKAIVVRDAETLQVRQKMATEHQNSILNAGYSPDGATFATIDAGGLLILWNTATWEPRHVLRSEVQNQLLGLAFTPDSRRVATGAFNGIVAVYDVATGEPVVEPFQAHSNGWAMSLIFSPDGQRFYSGSSSQTIRMWDATTFTPIGEPMEGHTNWVTDLAFAPDGATLISAGYDETIRTWDAATGEPIGEPFVGHGRPVWGVSYRTVDGSPALISVGADGAIIWWDWETRLPLGPPLRTGRESEWLRVSADGRRLLVSFMGPVVEVIDIDFTPWLERSCAVANRNLTATEWEEYLPSLPYRDTCFPTVE